MAEKPGSWRERRTQEQHLLISHALKRKHNLIDGDQTRQKEELHFICDAAAIEALARAPPGTAAAELRTNSQLYAADIGAAAGFKLWPGPGLLARDQNLLATLKNHGQLSEVQDSAKAFLAACDHVDNLWRKNRVFVTGNDMFLDWLTTEGLKGELDEAINRAGGGSALGYVCSTSNLPNKWELPAMASWESFCILVGVHEQPLKKTVGLGEQLEKVVHGLSGNNEHLKDFQQGHDKVGSQTQEQLMTTNRAPTGVVKPELPHKGLRNGLAPPGAPVSSTGIRGPAEATAVPQNLRPGVPPFIPPSAHPLSGPPAQASRAVQPVHPALKLQALQPVQILRLHTNAPPPNAHPDLFRVTPDDEVYLSFDAQQNRGFAPTSSGTSTQPPPFNSPTPWEAITVAAQNAPGNSDSKPNANGGPPLQVAVTPIAAKVTAKKQRERQQQNGPRSDSGGSTSMRAEPLTMANGKAAGGKAVCKVPLLQSLCVTLDDKVYLTPKARQKRGTAPTSSGTSKQPPPSNSPTPQEANRDAAQNSSGGYVSKPNESGGPPPQVAATPIAAKVTAQKQRQRQQQNGPRSGSGGSSSMRAEPPTMANGEAAGGKAVVSNRGNGHVASNQPQGNGRVPAASNGGNSLGGQNAGTVPRGVAKNVQRAELLNGPRHLVSGGESGVIGPNANGAGVTGGNAYGHQSAASGEPARVAGSNWQSGSKRHSNAQPSKFHCVPKDSAARMKDFKR